MYTVQQPQALLLLFDGHVLPARVLSWDILTPSEGCTITHQETISFSGSTWDVDLILRLTPSSTPKRMSIVRRLGAVWSAIKRKLTSFRRHLKVSIEDERGEWITLPNRHPATGAPMDGPVEVRFE